MSTVLDDLRHEIEKKKGSYLRAVALIQSPGWPGMRDAAFDRVCELARKFDGDPNKAAFTLGQIREALRAIEGPPKIVADYIEARERIEDLEHHSSPR